MNVDFQHLLDEMSKRFDGYDAKLTQRLSDYGVKLQQRMLDRNLELERRMADLDTRMDDKLASLSTANETRLSQLESVAISFDGWHPCMEGSVDDIRLHVSKLTNLYERSAVEHPTVMTGVLVPAPSPAVRPSAAASTDAQPDRHRLNPSIRDDGCGVVTILDHHPAKGASSPSHPMCLLLLFSTVRDPSLRNPWVEVWLVYLIIFLKCCFLRPMGINPSYGSVDVRITLICIVLIQRSG
ncbi:uncharacterized protein [Zea mays]|jgi:hypothetical protein|uniref:uncharacterized protein n=1 Tax=Zea mays TaxID=4577 RepID=UPI0002218F31|nr:uncharacterized protein LOC118472919 [Zea mays]